MDSTQNEGNGLNEAHKAYICEEVSRNLRSMISDEISKEESIRFRQIKWIIAMVSIIGLGTFGTMASSLIDKAVETKLENHAGKIRDALAFQKYYTMTLKLDLGTSFTPEDKDAVMAYLRKAAKDDTIRNEKDFLASLHQVAIAFVSATQSPELDEIFLLFEKEILTNQGILGAFLHHYGQGIATVVNLPKADTWLATFEKLERASRSQGQLRGLSLYYRIIYTYKLSQKSKQDDLPALIASIKDINPAEKSTLLTTLFRQTKTSTWQSEPTESGMVLQRLTRGLLSTYASDFATALGTTPDVFTNFAADGVPDERCEFFAKKLARASADDTSK